MVWEVEDVRTLLSSTTENREWIRIEGAEQFQLKKEKKSTNGVFKEENRWSIYFLDDPRDRSKFILISTRGKRKKKYLFFLHSIASLSIKRWGSYTW